MLRRRQCPSIINRKFATTHSQCCNRWIFPRNPIILIELYCPVVLCAPNYNSCSLVTVYFNVVTSYTRCVALDSFECIVRINHHLTFYEIERVLFLPIRGNATLKSSQKRGLFVFFSWLTSQWRPNQYINDCVIHWLWQLKYVTREHVWFNNWTVRLCTLRY